MLHGKLNQSGKPERRAPLRMKRSLAGGLVVALSAAALVGLNSGAAVSAAPSATAPVASSESSNSILRAKATKVTVTKVTATSTPITSGTRVATTVGVKNTHSQRMPALTVRLYLTSGAKKYKLGDARVKALSSGASTTVRATHNAPTAAPAGRYAVTACRGAYSVQKCRTSSSTVTIAPARLVSSAAALPLGDASVGSTSAPRVMTVTNRGHANTGTLSARVVGNSDFSVKSSTCRASLTPGKSCKVSVVFSPEAPGTVIGTLAVSGKFAKPISVALTGNGTGAALTITQWQDARIAAMTRIDTSVEALRRCATLGTVSLFSNNPSIFAASFSRLAPDVAEILGDNVVISCELGARKPTPESYERVLARYDASPANTFFADDNAGNIRGAIAAGIHGHHFTDPTLLDEAITAFAGRNS